MTVRAHDEGPIISVRNATKAFAGHPVVRELSFDVEQGRIFGLIGPSGCGKTTTIRLLTGIYRPSQGAIRVLGREPVEFRRQDRERIGYLPQHFVLYRELSVVENLGFVAGLYGLVLHRRQRIREALEFVELWDSRGTLAGNLSGGMQRRLGLAAALVHKPALVFVDEPTAGIDPVLRAKFWDGFRALRDIGHTIFLTTQYVTEADYCDEVAVLREGKLLVLGTPSEIRRRVVGGDALELEAEGLSRESLAELRNVPGIRKLTIISSELAHLIVDDAVAALPEVRRAVERLGLVVRRLGTRQVSFDEVFVRLMEQGTEQADGRDPPRESRANEASGRGEPGETGTLVESAPGIGGSSDV
jgi:ABC-2 type transport system ATP-binding protein